MSPPLFQLLTETANLILGLDISEAYDRAWVIHREHHGRIFSNVLNANQVAKPSIAR